MRAERWAPVIEIDVARVGRLIRADGFTPPEFERGVEWRCARSLLELELLLRCLDARKPWAFDVETVSLGATTTRLVCFAFSDGTRSIVVPWARDPAGQQSWWGWANEVRAAALVSRAIRDVTLITHNGPAFDLIVAPRFGIHVRRWEDTLLASHVLRGHMKKSLAHVVARHLDAPPWKEWAHGGGRELGMRQLWEYNARDVLYTARAWAEIRRELGT
jgi:hypothetical protein